MLGTKWNRFLVVGMAASSLAVGCGGDEEPAPQQQPTYDGGIDAGAQGLDAGGGCQFIQQINASAATCTTPNGQTGFAQCTNNVASGPCKTTLEWASQILADSGITVTDGGISFGDASFSFGDASFNLGDGGLNLPDGALEQLPACPTGFECNALLASLATSFGAPAGGSLCTMTGALLPFPPGCQTADQCKTAGLATASCVQGQCAQFCKAQ